MAHYAWLNENNLVINVTVGVDEDIVQQGVGGSTEAWEAFYYQATGHTIKRTSYNNNIRKQYAGIGYTYNPVNDVFIAPQPYPSWSLDENFDWQAPTPMPTDGNRYAWDEDSLSWVEEARSQMNATDWAGLIVALISILGSTALGVKWLVKHYLNELKPNGGTSIKDKVAVLEEKVDFLTDIVKEALLK
jgi:hypothetical protein